jgi:hypothetical protein
VVARHPEWALGYEDEVWWSRLAHPCLSAWSDHGQPLRLVEQTVAKDDPDPKALACYGLLVRWADPLAERLTEQMWLRFVQERPVSAVTTQFLNWCCDRLGAAGKTAFVLVWDNASWHISAQVRAWIRDHNQQVRREGRGVRIVVCGLPVKSPWLNPIEPKWVHGKRAVVEPIRLLTAAELEQRVCAYYRCAQLDHLSIPQKVT